MSATPRTDAASKARGPYKRINFEKNLPHRFLEVCKVSADMERELTALESSRDELAKDANDFAEAIFGSWISRDYLNDDGMFGCDHCSIRFNEIGDWTKIVHEPTCIVTRANARKAALADAGKEGA